ncbi:MAG: Wzz/FepE/Etk N-terminal domain-containing protein [Bacillota bacterium]
MEDTLEIDLREYLRVLKKRWWVLAMIIVVAVGTSAILSFFVLPPVYSASVTLIVIGKETPIVDYTTVMLHRQLVKTYREIAKSRTVMEKVISDLDLDFTVAEFQNKVKVDTVRDTEILKIEAEDTDPRIAVVIVQAVAQAFIDQVRSIMRVENVEIIDPPLEPILPVRPRPKLNLAIAGVLGLMIGVLVVFLLEYLDNTIKTPEDVQRYLNLPVLGVIPFIASSEDGKTQCSQAD